MTLRHVRPVNTQLLDKIRCDILVSLPPPEATAVYRSLRPEIGRRTERGIRTEISFTSGHIRIKCTGADPSKIRAVLNSLLRLVSAASRVLEASRQMEEKALFRAEQGNASRVVK